MHVNVGVLVLYYIILDKNKCFKYFIGRTLDLSDFDEARQQSSLEFLPKKS